MGCLGIDCFLRVRGKGGPQYNPGTVTQASSGFDGIRGAVKAEILPAAVLDVLAPGYSGTQAPAGETF